MTKNNRLYFNHTLKTISYCNGESIFEIANYDYNKYGNIVINLNFYKIEDNMVRIKKDIINLLSPTMIINLEGLGLSQSIFKIKELGKEFENNSDVILKKHNFISDVSLVELVNCKEYLSYLYTKEKRDTQDIKLFTRLWDYKLGFTLAPLMYSEFQDILKHHSECHQEEWLSRKDCLFQFSKSGFEIEESNGLIDEIKLPYNMYTEEAFGELDSGDVFYCWKLTRYDELCYLYEDKHGKLRLLAKNIPNYVSILKFDKYGTLYAIVGEKEYEIEKDEREWNLYRIYTYGNNN